MVERYNVKWCRNAGTPKPAKVKWNIFGVFTVIEIQELPQSEFEGQYFDNAEMIVESDKELDEWTIERLKSGRVYVCGIDEIP
jgi:hypothetical protein